MKFNRPEITQAWARFLGLKGAPEQSREELLTVINVGNLFDTPYLRYKVPVAESDTRAAVVGQLSAVVIRPGANVCLAVKQIICPATAAFQNLSIRIATLAQLAAATTPPAGSLNVVDLAPDLGQLGTLRSSVIQQYADVGFIGNGLFGMSVAANGTTAIHEFPDVGFVLYGNDPNGRGGIVVQQNAANVDLHVGFVAYEWPLPG